MTFSPIPAGGQDDPQAIIVWDIRTGQKKRGFYCETQSTWPILKYDFICTKALTRNILE